jgi:hypothetical protein
MNNQVNQRKEMLRQNAPAIGVMLVGAGLLLLLDQRLQTTWLSLSIPIFISLIAVVAGIYTKMLPWLLTGFILLGLSGSLFLILQKIYSLQLSVLIGLSFTFNSLCWLVMVITVKLLHKVILWWGLFVIFCSIGIGYIFIYNHQTFLTYVLVSSIAIGVSFLVWGGFTRKLGLFIPGLLIVTIGAGIYIGWKGQSIQNGLQETGTMLVWFALGWILITVFSRIFTKKFVWWPLIPGGVLTMVGSGLYIGGNPSNVLGFIRNTGSIGLILFGIYLILLKFGFKK